MIGKVDIDYSSLLSQNYGEKINELVDAVNGILAAQEQYATIYNEDIVPMLTPQNEEPDFITTTYPTDGHTKEYYGQNGASVATDHPLPAGYVITIRETRTKGLNNDRTRKEERRTTFNSVRKTITVGDSI